MVGQLLDHVGGAVAVSAQLGQPHHVAVQPEHAVQVGQVPVLEVHGERQRRQAGVIGRVGELQSHGGQSAPP